MLSKWDCKTHPTPHIALLYLDKTHAIGLLKSLKIVIDVLEKNLIRYDVAYSQFIGLIRNGNLLRHDNDLYF